ncbi:hypothetical protein Rhopal_004990-T1 [Rhodotorula paludigena]|uniref:Sucrase/ferredoxin-like-domain-containing protein n=1 Tax=Rhodotorula paludigena TaxID=86838 RepID=A0AAV5GRG2_9BASI|nr:hypothetical protein Rhopal_004990-T1 [Rhodotorula paludigena]
MVAPVRPAPPAALVDALRAAHIPVESLEEACRACGEACDEDDDAELDYPKGFDMDLESTMLGELKPYGRQILVSTGKSDWIREVTDDDESITGLVRKAYDNAVKDEVKGGKGVLGKLGNKLFGGSGGDKDEAGPPGVHPSSAAPPIDTSVSSKLSVLASSFVSSSHEGHRESVIVLPDYKVVHEVEASRVAAEELVQGYLQPDAGRAGAADATGSLRSWPLPYHCIVLLCSHRKRDKRCSIAAPLLISQFHHHLEKHGLHVDERGDDLTEDGLPIEEWEGAPEEKELRLRETLQGVKTDGGRVGLFKVSHIGGHRYAGNVILYFPNGSSVWFGRVTPADVGTIVDRTIMQGKVIPELLRGGLGLEGKDGGPRGVLDW